LVILLKVRGAIQLSFFDRCKKYIVIAAVSCTVGVSYVYIYDNKPNAYEVSVNDKVVAYIREDNDAVSFIKALGDEVQNRFGSPKLKECIALNKAKVSEQYLSDSGALRKAVLANSDIEVEAYSMLVDGREVAIVASEAEGAKVLDNLKSYYTTTLGIKVKESKIKNNIAYSKTKTALSKVQDIDKIVTALKDANFKFKNPVITVQIIAEQESTQSITPPTTITWSDSMTVGQSSVKSVGKEGQKLLTKELILDNNKVISSKVINEKITTPAQARVVVQGSKSPVSAKVGVFASPSRGTVSSSFGMRWGRMHEGLDIAASTGEPIYAALDGTVTYAGWEEGYGKFIKLKHSDGLETAYGHCSVISVKVGQSVKKGEKIGEVGNTGNSTGPHLHFEVRQNGQPKNPTAYLK
jgi:murein DD-endopeptidase MepM/ murein hydrolase activator NlpD